MKEIGLMPGYAVNEYLLVLVPHEELRNRIIKVKKEFAEQFRLEKMSAGRPHLALVRFTQYEMLEERIRKRLNQVALGQHPFKVELQHFGSLPTHSIFIQVTTREPIRDLVRQVRESQKLLRLDQEHKPHFIDDPYIGIARKLLPWQYEEGWKEYAHRQFTGRFIADAMLLLKRREGTMPYQIAQRFEFQNLPVATKQGELFAY